MNVPKDYRYTKDHEWVKQEGDLCRIGITDHAQDMLGDITFVELPEPESAVNQGDEVCSVESAKAASGVFAPVGGTIAEVNSELEDAPETLNSDPHGAGWIFTLRPADAAQMEGLMDADTYTTFLENEEH